jgi:uncharacterized membrane protein
VFALTVAHASSVSVLVVSVFLASLVEMVEALTIVVAVGTTRSWRSAFEGVAVALLALGALVGIFGPTLVHVPLNVLRIVVGFMLLIFGLQWWRKAVMRSVGLKAKHDEDLIFAETVAELRAQDAAPNRDYLAFVTSFKGVFLEGLEVVVAVLTLGLPHRVALASSVALVAVAIVAIVGAIVARQLSSVPENAMKMTVAIMLVSYGTFWLGEGCKIKWPGADTMLLGLVAIYGLSTIGVIRYCRAQVRRA